ncbi:hypothetical protein [Yinghuangia seranimata]|uniref:hypothetical protein n=1 Tax=Yinghuangia seranimata TaxID=408067 RepID=UPI00248AE988|nr:hypothetical protein [Yinghuangia seranimata]MDI2130584.1 hypothetical protein [Yinghuangia seranimata]
MHTSNESPNALAWATPHKYFPDLPPVLTAWCERQAKGHLAQLAAVDPADPPTEPGG